MDRLTFRRVHFALTSFYTPQNSCFRTNSSNFIYSVSVRVLFCFWNLRAFIRRVLSGRELFAEFNGIQFFEPIDQFERLTRFQFTSTE